MITNDKLIEILIKSGVDIRKNDIDPDKAFDEQGLDSLELFNFFTEIDNEFGIEVPDEVFDQLNTINKLRVYLESL